MEICIQVLTRFQTVRWVRYRSPIVAWFFCRLRHNHCCCLQASQLLLRNGHLGLHRHTSKRTHRPHQGEYNRVWAEELCEVMIQLQTTTTVPTLSWNDGGVPLTWLWPNANKRCSIPLFNLSTKGVSEPTLSAFPKHTTDVGLRTKLCAASSHSTLSHLRPVRVVLLTLCAHRALKS